MAGPADVLQGVYVANVTPFRDDDRYSIDVDAYLAHARWLATTGVTGLVPFGTNGEGPSVAPHEKRTVVEALVAEAGSLQVVPAVAEGNLPDTLDLLAALDDLPVRAVMVLPPYYFKPVGTDGLRPFYERVLAATRHPVALYHIPKYAVPLPLDLVTALAVWGVKDSGGEAGYAQAVRDAGKGVLLGSEDDLPARLPTAEGAISALANVIPEQVVALYEHVRAGRADEAAELSGHLQAVRAMTKEHSSAGVLKRLAEQRHGTPMGTVRPPLAPVPSSFDAAGAAARATAGPVPRDR
ncbi:dihydrodipicolinate synthase family protein [Geodermatophilus sp. CPCC 206100]|uniref:dihydrodipicolinate synthase family protein n=1 Tax=Geodermatophilus sp. CPCC 206100 TaxID=3020054 RepID=UPI003B00C389